MTSIGNVKTHADAVVTADVEDVPPMMASYMDQAFRPNRIIATYRYEPIRHGAWTEHAWRCLKIEVTGFRLLRPGPGGVERLGKDIRKWSAYAYISGVLPVAEGAEASSKDVPEWVAAAVSRLRPYGEVSTASL